jgi:hypothetical protein
MTTNHDQLIEFHRKTITDLFRTYDDTPKSERHTRLKIQLRVLELKKEISRLQYLSEIEEETDLILQEPDDTSYDDEDR